MDQLQKQKWEKLLGQIHQQYPGVRHISSQQLVSLIKGGVQPILLDVRTLREYQISHLKGAQYLSPSSWTSTVLNKYGKGVKGRIVILYCSVGVRSSKMATRVQKGLLKAGAKGVYNLKGGLFAWGNEGRPVTSQGKKASHIHPYNKYWGQLLEKNLHRY